MDVIDEVWVWVHQKYGIGLIVWKFYSFKTNRLSYLYDPDDDQFHQQNN